MFPVIWNSLAFHVIDKLWTGAKMESDYFTPNILGPLEQKVFPTGRNPHAKRLTIHLHHCSIHTSRTTEECIRQNNMIRLQHPPYSPDLRPSDFYLFQTIKEKPKDIQMADEEDLFYPLHPSKRGWTESLYATTTGAEPEDKPGCIVFSLDNSLHRA
jgi:hypothetical protein